MIVAALPSPPLPIIVSQQMADELTFVQPDTVHASSHDLIAFLLVDAMERKNKDADERRFVMQKAAHDRFIADIAEDKLKPYEIFCNYTRRYISTFVHCVGIKVPDIRFADEDDVCNGDHVHFAICHYLSGQDLLCGETDRYLPEDDATEGEDADVVFVFVLLSFLLVYQDKRTRAEKYFCFRYPQLVARQFQRLRDSVKAA